MKILTALLVIVSVIAVLSITRCDFNARRFQEASSSVGYLVDTVKTYQDKQGRISKERTILQTSVKDLKRINSNLYKELKTEKGRVKYVTTTKLVYQTDTLHRSGSVQFTILNDSVLTDFKLDLDTLVLGIRDGKVFAKTTDSSLVITDIDATEILKNPKRLGLGFFVGPGVGYGTRGVDVQVSAGFGVVFKVR